MSKKELQIDRRTEFIYSHRTFLTLCLSALQWEHWWAFICPTRRLLHLFACGQDRQRRGLWNSLHSSHRAQVSGTRHKSAVSGEEGGLQSQGHAAVSQNEYQNEAIKYAHITCGQTLFATERKLSGPLFCWASSVEGRTWAWNNYDKPIHETTWIQPQKSSVPGCFTVHIWMKLTASAPEEHSCATLSCLLASSHTGLKALVLASLLHMKRIIWVSICVIEWAGVADLSETLRMSVNNHKQPSWGIWNCHETRCYRRLEHFPLQGSPHHSRCQWKILASTLESLLSWSVPLLRITNEKPCCQGNY